MARLAAKTHSPRSGQALDWGAVVPEHGTRPERDVAQIPGAVAEVFPAAELAGGVAVERSAGHDVPLWHGEAGLVCGNIEIVRVLHLADDGVGRMCRCGLLLLSPMTYTERGGGLFACFPLTVFGDAVVGESQYFPTWFVRVSSFLTSTSSSPPSTISQYSRSSLRNLRCFFCILSLCSSLKVVPGRVSNSDSCHTRAGAYRGRHPMPRMQG